ncbi:MAG: hypothetical protein H6551_05575 [Chitinophagales bacterium]|nr:hypothetical protein [Chitinophagaceae bacterium]MCB9064600.1 hypothetical protein [Chitinophagales bacterium]
MKRQTRFLLIAGGLLMGLAMLVNHYFVSLKDPSDFIKGIGVAFILSSLFVQRKLTQEQKQ